LALSPSRREWAAMWPVPLTGLIGVVACSAFAYSNSVFMLAMTREFGWTRTQFSSAFLLQMLATLMIGPLVGWLTDRLGPRRVALGGMLPYVLGLSLLGLADGSVWQWRLLCAVYAAGAGAIGLTVWVAAATRRFDAGRGLAMGVVLAGTGVATGLWPLAATALIALFGWRLAFPAMAFGSVALLLPMTLAFVRDRDELPLKQGASFEDSAPLRLLPIVLSRTFLCLLFAGSLFVSITFGLTLNLVPILTTNGFSSTLAASAAIIAGVGVLIGRVGAGWLLDRLPTRHVAIFAFLLPIVELLCLWRGQGSVGLSLIGVAALGLTGGGESDVLVYMTSRRFAPKLFALLYSIFLAVFACAAGLGPVLASAVFDATGSYAGYMLLCMPMALVALALIMAVPEETPGRNAS
jgi:MFS family permease